MPTENENEGNFESNESIRQENNQFLSQEHGLQKILQNRWSKGNYEHDRWFKGGEDYNQAIGLNSFEQHLQMQSQGLTSPVGRPSPISLPNYKEYEKNYQFQSGGSITLDVDDGGAYGTTGWYIQKLNLNVRVRRISDTIYTLDLNASTVSDAQQSFSTINYWATVLKVIDGVTSGKEINFSRPPNSSSIGVPGSYHLGFISIDLPQTNIKSFAIKIKSSYTVVTDAGAAVPVSHPLYPNPTSINEQILIYP